MLERNGKRQVLTAPDLEKGERVEVKNQHTGNISEGRVGPMKEIVHVPGVRRYGKPLYEIVDSEVKE